MKAAYLVTIEGVHPDADTREVGPRLKDALNSVMRPLSVQVSPQWVLVSEEERKRDHG